MVLLALCLVLVVKTLKCFVSIFRSCLDFDRNCDENPSLPIRAQNANMTSQKCCIYSRLPIRQHHVSNSDVTDNQAIHNDVIYYHHSPGRVLDPKGQVIPCPRSKCSACFLEQSNVVGYDVTSCVPVCSSVDYAPAWEGCGSVYGSMNRSQRKSSYDGLS